MNLKVQVANAALLNSSFPAARGPGGRFPSDAPLQEPVIPADVGGKLGGCLLETG